MPLNLGGGGDIKPNIRWMAQTSAWQISAEGGKQTVQLNEFVADLDNLQTGWCVFREGQAPQWVLDPNLSQAAPRPSDEKDAQGSYVWKRGFKVDLFSPNTFGGDGVREFGTNATGACMGMDALYTAFEAQRAANPGQLPVVKYTGPMPTKIGKGSTNVPQFAIVKFVPRPAALGNPASIPTQDQVVAAHQNAAVNQNAAAPQAASVSEF